MKKLAIGLAAAVAMMAVVGSAVHAAEPLTGVVGKWSATGNDGNGRTIQMVLDLKPSGEYEATMSDLLGNPVGKVSGTYTYFFGTLTMTTNGKAISYTLTWVDEDTFKDGEDTYSRVK